jgi:hypothetical protein
MDLDEAKALIAKARRQSIDRRVDELIAPILSAYDQTHRGLTRAHRARREKFELRARAALLPVVQSWVDMVESEWTE